VVEEDEEESKRTLVYEDDGREPRGLKGLGQEALAAKNAQITSNVSHIIEQLDEIIDSEDKEQKNVESIMYMDELKHL